MTTAVIVLLVLLVVFMLMGVPVGFAIGGATMASMWFCSDLNMVVNAQYCYSGYFLIYSYGNSLFYAGRYDHVHRRYRKAYC